MQFKSLYNLSMKVPFKEKKDAFMSYKDPSSILRIIIEEAYKDTGSFEAIPDIMFIYNCMYNGNSLNIRNECIHGRDYQVGGGLSLAFKITMLSIIMINNRLEFIKSNIQKQ